MTKHPTIIQPILIRKIYINIINNTENKLLYISLFYKYNLYIYIFCYIFLSDWIGRRTVPSLHTQGVHYKLFIYGNTIIIIVLFLQLCGPICSALQNNAHVNLAWLFPLIILWSGYLCASKYVLAIN